MSNGTSQNGNASSNGVHPDAAAVTAHDLAWDSLPPAVTAKLAGPLDPGLVSHRKGRAGRAYAYLEGRTAIDQANRIFGHGGWGYELVGEVAPRDIEQVDAKTGEVKRVRAYAATVRVAVPGATPRTDVGFHAVAEENAEGHETAFKGAVTDGLKRALRSFGDRFGNSLYGDGTAQQAGGKADALAPSLRQTLVDLGVTQGFDERQVREAVRSRTGRDLDELPASELTPLVEGAARKMHQSGDGETKEAA